MSKDKMICIGMTIAVGLLCVVFWISAMQKHTKAAEDAFASAKSETYEQTKADEEKAAYDKAYSENKVTNDVAISVGSLRSEAELEVLEVFDVEYIIEEEEDNEEGILSWLMVPGKGVYTVDLTAAEFIVDEERCYVLVRVPEPEMKDCTIVYNEVQQLLFKNKGFNESISIGEDAARKQLQEAYVRLEKNLGVDLNFYQSAELSAKRVITSLVKALNVKIPDLIVEVEFIN